MTTIQEAKEILGESFVFGPDLWLKILGNKAGLLGNQPAKAPEIPWSCNVLKKPGLDQPHFLFLGFNTLGNKPFNLRACKKIGYFNDSGFIDLKSVCRFRWYLMTVGVVKGSENLTYNQQTAEPLFPHGYEVPNTVERVIANILFHKLLSQKGRYLDQDHWVFTSDTPPFVVQHLLSPLSSLTITPNDKLCVGAFTKGLRQGLNLARESTLSPLPQLGISASLKFIPLELQEVTAAKKPNHVEIEGDEIEKWKAGFSKIGWLEEIGHNTNKALSGSTDKYGLLKEDLLCVTYADVLQGSRFTSLFFNGGDLFARTTALIATSHRFVFVSRAMNIVHNPAHVGQ